MDPSRTGLGSIPDGKIGRGGHSVCLSDAVQQEGLTCARWARHSDHTQGGLVVKQEARRISVHCQLPVGHLLNKDHWALRACS